MIDLNHNSGATGLLVSVRDAEEAVVALTAGADVIDIKEPNRGSLGAADTATIAAVVKAIAGRAPVSAALGELVDLGVHEVPAGVAFVKIGLAGCGRVPEWQSRWRRSIDAICRHDGSPPQPVAVVYADWRAADAPNPDEILQAAVDMGCPGLLVDTWDKSGGDLFCHWPTKALRVSLDRARAHLGFVVLAGSLAGESFRRAAALSPNLVAVRGAACDAGRGGSISAARIGELKKAIRGLSGESGAPCPSPAPELLRTRAGDKFS